MHDLVIRNALLLDGLGSSPKHGDVAVSKEKISQLRNETGFYKQFPEKDLFQVNVIIGETTYISFIDLEENKVIYFRRAIGVTIQ